MEATARAPGLPTRLGRFEPRRPLGGGGGGNVVEAWDPARGESVALKMLGPGDARAFARFKREFRAVAEASHPNLVTLHELFFEDDRLFFSMELLDGVGFLEWVRPGGQLDVARLRDAMRQLARAVAALHASGKLHRDIKSSNVLVTRAGRVVLLDFGFVLDASAATSLDRKGLVVGTPVYMSPEQAFGLQVGTASDWYSVGVVLYEALTGQRPFQERDPAALLRKRLSREPPWPSTRVDVDLPADLEALCVGLLRRVGSARPDVGAIIATLGDASPDPVVRRTSQTDPDPGFVGRADEVSRIEHMVDEVRAGHPAAALVHGSSGMGKSALLRHVAARLRGQRGLRVWAGRCYERESMPYKAFDGIIDGLVDELAANDDPLTHLCEPAEVHALVRLFPALARLTGVRDTSLALPSSANAELRDRAYAALKRVLAHVTHGAPVVVVIDDLQWCDTDSIRLWTHLLGPPGAPAIAVVGAYREDALWAGTPLARVLARSSQSGSPLSTVDVSVGALDLQASRALAQRLLDEGGLDRPGLATTVARESDGSPLFLHELIEHAKGRPELFDRPPDTARWAPPLDEVLGERIGRLSHDARRVLETIVIAGQRVEQGTVLRAALGDGATATTIDVLRRSRLVSATGFTDRDWIEPRHDRIRRQVLDALTPAQRRARHLALAQAMAGSARSEPEALATHFAQAGANELAALHALYAASLASEGLAFGLAAHWYELALAHLADDDARRSSVEASMGHALASEGRGYEGAQALLRAAASASAPERRQLRRLAAHWLVYSGDLGTGRRLLMDLLREAGLPFPRSRFAAIVSLLGLRARVRLRGLAFEQRDASEIPAEDLHRIDLCWAVGLMLNGDPILGAGFLARHLLLALRVGEPTRIAPALAYEAVARMVSGRITAERAREEVDVAAEMASRTHDAEAEAWVAFVRPTVSTAAGEWRQALGEARHAAKRLQAHTTGSGLPILTCQYLEAWARFQMGQWATLAPLVHRLIAAGGRANPHRGSAHDLLAFPLSLAADDPERALALLRERDASEPSGASQRGVPFRFAARVFTHLYQDDTEAAWAVVRAQRRELERGMRFRPAIAQALHLWSATAAATARVATGDDRGLRRAQRDVHRLAGLAFRPASALAQLAGAGLLAAQGEHAGAIAGFEAAAAAFDETEMRIHAAVARHRSGSLLGGEAGATMVESARAFMHEAGVVAPDRLAHALAAGLRRPD